MERFKYPRTYHLPWSPGRSDDDKVLHDLSHFEGKQVVVTEKMDGENTTMYPDGYCHARSIDSKGHEARSWVKAFAYEKCPQIRDGIFKEHWHICGENVYAQHSIKYDDLKSYFYMFSFWENDICLEWNYTKNIAEAFGITLVPVMYEGIFDITVLKALEANLRPNQEGFVVRTIDNIYPSDWPTHVAKWVRPNHVQTEAHWMYQEVVKNNLRSSK